MDQGKWWKGILKMLKMVDSKTQVKSTAVKDCPNWSEDLPWNPHTGST